MLAETSAISGSKTRNPHYAAPPPSRLSIRRVYGDQFDKATAAAIDEMVGRENRARSWVVSDLVVASLKRSGARRASDRAA